MTEGSISKLYLQNSSNIDIYPLFRRLLFKKNWDIDNVIFKYARKSEYMFVYYLNLGIEGILTPRAKCCLIVLLLLLALEIDTPSRHLGFLRTHARTATQWHSRMSLRPLASRLESIFSSERYCSSWSSWSFVGPYSHLIDLLFVFHKKRLQPWCWANSCSIIFCCLLSLGSLVPVANVQVCVRQHSRMTAKDRFLNWEGEIWSKWDCQRGCASHK